MSNPNPITDKLKPWKPGETGNPKGRPKGVANSKTRLLRLLEITQDLQNPITGSIEGFTVLEQLDLAQIIKAKKGDTKAYDSILDRLEGKPQQKMSFATENTSELLDTIEQSDYGQLGQEAEKQMVALDAPVQDKEQAGPASNIQTELSPTPAPIPAGSPPLQPRVES